MKCNCCGSKKTIKDNEGNIFCSNCGYYIQRKNDGELCTICTERTHGTEQPQNNKIKYTKRPEINIVAVIFLFMFGLGVFAFLYIISTVSKQRKWDRDNK